MGSRFQARQARIATATMYTKLKRFADIALSAPLCLALSPAMGAIALGIKLEDGGPAVFRQERLGLGGRVFTMFKFRTMSVGAERKMELNADGSVKTVADDMRITRVGRFLRKTSLDELPQLLNVLRGDMSVIGPRPDLPLHAEYYNERHRRKLEVRPGITGLAQVSGRNELPWERRLELDVEYVENLSLALDVSIFFRTFTTVLSRRAVYASGSAS
ncbi:MAG: sugar transferase [Polyangiaceae bacterium]